MKPQLLSQRHNITLRTISSDHGSRLIHLWQFFQGNKFFVIVSLLLSAGSVVTVLGYKDVLNEKDFRSSLYLSLLFIVYGENVAFWDRGRKTAQDISKQLVNTALLLEKRATEEQKQLMMKATRTARIMAFIYMFNLVANDIMFFLEPFSKDGNLAAPMPYLPDGPFFYWGMYLIQSAICIPATVAFYSQISYLSEVCLSVSASFTVLSEHFLKMEDRQEFRALVPIHQSLLEISKSLMRLFRFTWFIILGVQVSLLICNTYFIIDGDRSPMLFAVIVTIMGFLYPSFMLSERMSQTSEHIEYAALHNEYAIRTSAGRTDVCFVVLRSQRPVFMTAMLFGRLGFEKYLAVIEKWYSIVQALLNLKYN